MTNWMFDETHKYTRGSYDLAVDTAVLMPNACALQIKHVVDARGTPLAIKHLIAR